MLSSIQAEAGFVAVVGTVVPGSLAEPEMVDFATCHVEQLQILGQVYLL